MQVKPNNTNVDKTHENFGAIYRNSNPSITGTDCFTELKTFRLKNLKNLMRGYLPNT